MWRDIVYKKLVIPTALFVGLLGITGCTAPGSVADKVRTEVSQPPTQNAEPEFDANAVTKEFVTSVYSSDFENAALLASPESPAARYVIHQMATDKAYQVNGDAGDTSLPPTVTLNKDGSVTATYSDGLSFLWSDFQFDDRGLVSSWTTPSGDLATLLWTADWQGVVGPNTYTLVSAYKSNSGDMNVTLRVDAAQRTALFHYSASFVGSDSINYSASYASGPNNDIPAGSSAFLVLSFPQAPFGGTVYLQGYYPEDGSSSLEVAIPVS